jgi:hypothetical protein
VDLARGRARSTLVGSPRRYQLSAPRSCRRRRAVAATEGPPVQRHRARRKTHPRTGLSEEGSGILNWAIAGYQDWQLNGLQEPEAVTNAIAQYRSSEDIGRPRAKWHPHVLKHSLATHLIAGNVNLAVVKRALGHKSIGSTMVYVTVSDRQAGDASRAALMSLY